MSSVKIFHYHVRNKENMTKGGVTFAFEVTDTDMVKAYAQAKCHIKDNFCKRTGRIKSEGRLKSMSHRIDVGGATCKDFIAWLKTLSIAPSGALISTEDI